MRDSYLAIVGEVRRFSQKSIFVLRYNWGFLVSNYNNLCNDPGKKKKKKKRKKKGKKKKTRKRNKRKKKNSSRRKTREFFDDRRVSRTPRETTATPRPAFSSQLSAPSEYLQREKRQKITRERERDFGQTSTSVQFLRRTLKPPSIRHQTTYYHDEKDP